MASAAELSFNWTGFISAMISNLTFGFRAVLGKKCAAAASAVASNVANQHAAASTTLTLLFVMASDWGD